MKRLLLTSFLAFNFLGAQDYNPFSYDYGFPPPASAPSDECSKFFGNVDFIVLRSASDGQVFGTEYIEGEEGPDALGGVKRVHFPTSYDFGFRLLGGFCLPGDQWAGSASWFWYNSKQEAFRDDPGFGNSRRGGSYFQPGIDGVAEFSDLSSPIEASGSWHLNFNQFDFEASRDFLVGYAVTLKPAVGFRILSLHENVDYNSIILVDPEVNYMQSRLRGSLWGIGPVAGLDTFMELGWGLGAFVNTRVALLCSHQEQKQQLVAPLAILPLDLSSVDFNNDSVSLKTALDFYIGLEWRMKMNYGMHFFFARFAFEEHLLLKAFNYPCLQNSDTLHIPFYSEQPHDIALFGFSFSVGFAI